MAHAQAFENHTSVTSAQFQKRPVVQFYYLLARRIEREPFDASEIDDVISSAADELAAVQ